MKNIVLFLMSLSFVLPLTAQRIQRDANGLYGIALSKNNGSVKWVVKPKYADFMKSPDGSFCLLNQQGKWGVVSKKGKVIIPFKYPSAEDAAEQYKYYIDPQSKDYASNSGMVRLNSSDPTFTFTRDYTPYIKNYVENKINEWQKKGEFEKSLDYKRRVTEETRKEMVRQFTQEVCDECLSKVQDKELRLRLDEYDADNETFLIDSELGSFVVPVPINDAPRFKNNWSKISTSNIYDIVNGKIILGSAVFTLDGKTIAKYNESNQVLYSRANVQYNFDPIEIPLQEERKSGNPAVAVNTLQVGKSDVDVNVPSTKKINDKTFALIFANENYREEKNVDFAINDGLSINKYFTETLGIPSSNIHIAIDATKNDIIREIDWLKNVSSAYERDIKVYVYYAGHGIPDEKDRSAYIIPVDGVSKNQKTLYSLKDFYSEIGALSENPSLIFLDACFSGALRGEGMLTSARGVKLKAKEEMPAENLIVLSAAQGDETAWPYHEKGHGLFTYFFLKKLQESKGNASLGDLSDYIKNEVGKNSVVINSKKQTPQINVSQKLLNSWTSIQLNN